VTIIFRPGRLAPDRSRARLVLEDYLALRALPTPPRKRSWMGSLSYGMLGNDRLGDCVEAEVLHRTQSSAYSGRGLSVVPTDQDAIRLYEAVAGYNPADPNSDQGTDMQAMQAYWRKTGVLGYKSLAYAELSSVQSLDLVRAAIDLFGGLSVGLNFPASAMTQFNDGEGWSIVPDDGGIEGGHAVFVGGYDQDAGTFDLVTWARVITMTEAFWLKYVEEAWCPILPEWLNAQGKSPEGLDLASLGLDFHDLTGDPNPFPAPPTPPTPPVPPTPPTPSAFLQAALTLVQSPEAQAFATEHHMSHQWQKLAADIRAMIAAADS